MSVFTIALTLFIIANPIGVTPVIVSLIKDFDFKRQRFIAFREAMLALFLALFFQYFGEVFLNALQIKPFAVTITGGLLLFAVALSMIFSFHESTEEAKQVKQEPFFVPIATPIISGPGLLATIMILSQRENNNFKLTMAILLAWIPVTAVMTFAPYLQKIFGKRGLAGMEQLMGMILALLSMELVVKGTAMLYHAIYT